jgi:hypothetical protein
MRSIFVAGCMLLATAAGEAAAQNALEAATKWGLLGTWAIDCKAKPEPQNAFYTYMRQNKALVLKRDLGRDHKLDTSEIVSGVLTADGGIELAIYFRQVTPPAVRTQRLLKEDGGYRVLFNRDQHDAYSSRDSKFTANGAPAKVNQRCAR